MATTFSFPTTVVFGPGSIAQLPERLEKLNVKHPLIVTDPGLADAEPVRKVRQLLHEKCDLFAKVAPNPAEADVIAAAKAFVDGRCDAVIAVGGGSAMDVGKALRLLVKRPEKTLAEFEFEFPWRQLATFVALPTTAGTGSEVGRSSVIVLDGKKAVIFHPSLLADLVILDPELTIALPPKLTAATGADALTHCIESYTSPTYHPLCDAIALEGIRLITEALPRVVRNGKDLEARGTMQIAAMMGGIAFQKDLGAAHSLAHPLSALCGIHHGTANAIVLPTVMEFNAERKPGVYRRVGEAMGLYDAADAAVIKAVRQLLLDSLLGFGLKAAGVRPDQLDALADAAFADGCHATNPVPVTRDDLKRLYERSM
jgi:alcohol dehydrogenase class IV